MTEVIALITVAHEDVLTLGGSDSAHQGIPISLMFRENDAHAHGFGNGWGAVAAAVVSYDDFAINVVLPQGALNSLDTGPQGSRLVQTRQHDAELRCTG